MDAKSSPKTSSRRVSDADFKPSPSTSTSFTTPSEVPTKRNLPHRVAKFISRQSCTPQRFKSSFELLKSPKVNFATPNSRNKILSTPVREVRIENMKNRLQKVLFKKKLLKDHLKRNIICHTTSTTTKFDQKKELLNENKKKKIKKIKKISHEKKKKKKSQTKATVPHGDLFEQTPPLPSMGDGKYPKIVKLKIIPSDEHFTSNASQVVPIDDNTIESVLQTSMPPPTSLPKMRSKYHKYINSEIHQTMAILKRKEKSHLLEREVNEEENSAENSPPPVMYYPKRMFKEIKHPLVIENQVKEKFLSNDLNQKKNEYGFSLRAKNRQIKFGNSFHFGKANEVMRKTIFQSNTLRKGSILTKFMTKIPQVRKHGGIFSVNKSSSFGDMVGSFKLNPNKKRRNYKKRKNKGMGKNKNESSLGKRKILPNSNQPNKRRKLENNIEEKLHKNKKGEEDSDISQQILKSMGGQDKQQMTSLKVS